MARLVRDYSQLAGISEGFLKASRREEVLEALRRGLALLFDLASTRYFRLEDASLVGEAAAGHGELIVPYQESSGLLARCLARGEVLDSFSPLAAPSIFDEQLARLLGAEGILCLPLRAEGQGSACWPSASGLATMPRWPPAKRSWACWPTRPPWPCSP